MVKEVVGAYRDEHGRFVSPTQGYALVDVKRFRQGNMVRTTQKFLEITGSVFADDPMKKMKRKVTYKYLDEKGKVARSETKWYEYTVQDYQSEGFNNFMDSIPLGRTTEDGADVVTQELVDEWKEMYAHMSDSERTKWWKLYHDMYPVKEYSSTASYTFDTDEFVSYRKLIEELFAIASPSTFSIFAD